MYLGRLDLLIRQPLVTCHFQILCLKYACLYEKKRSYMIYSYYLFHSNNSYEKTFPSYIFFFQGDTFCRSTSLPTFLAPVLEQIVLTGKSMEMLQNLECPDIRLKTGRILSFSSCVV